MRTRGRDEKKERERERHYHKPAFYMEHPIYHSLHEMQSKDMSVTAAYENLFSTVSISFDGGAAAVSFQSAALQKNNKTPSNASTTENNSLN